MLSPEEYAQLPYEQRYPEHIAVPEIGTPEWEVYVREQFDQIARARDWDRAPGAQMELEAEQAA